MKEHNKDFEAISALDLSLRLYNLFNCQMDKNLNKLTLISLACIRFWISFRSKHHFKSSRSFPSHWLHLTNLNCLIDRLRNNPLGKPMEPTGVWKEAHDEPRSGCILI